MGTKHTLPHSLPYIHTHTTPPQPPTWAGKVGYRVHLANRGDEQEVRPFKVAFDLGNVSKTHVYIHVYIFIVCVCGVVNGSTGLGCPPMIIHTNRLQLNRGNDPTTHTYI